MSSMLGKNLQISIFGESHGECVGVTVHGMPSGFEINEEYINRYLSRRATGKDSTVSSRTENDTVKYVSGVYNGKTTGAPLTMIIENSDCHSKDYKDMERLARPSHADYTGNVRYNGFNDIRGGGHFSGRLTTAMVMAGALCLSYLESLGIYVCGNVIQIGNVRGETFDDNTLNKVTFESMKARALPTFSNEKAMLKEINNARMNLDSVGGYVECAVIGMPVGIGSPIFEGLENNISKAIFGVPAVKGIEFGQECELRGSVYNDKLYIDNGDIKTLTNHDGGINGGISNGMPIIFKVKMKPTPSIAREQATVDFKTKTAETIAVKGRHDPCVVVRAVPCIECMTGIAVLDSILTGKIYKA